MLSLAKLPRFSSGIKLEDDELDLLMALSPWDLELEEETGWLKILAELELFGEDEVPALELLRELEPLAEIAD